MWSRHLVNVYKPVMRYILTLRHFQVVWPWTLIFSTPNQRQIRVPRDYPVYHGDPKLARFWLIARKDIHRYVVFLQINDLYYCIRAPAMGWITSQDGDPHGQVGEERQSISKNFPIPMCAIVPILVPACQTRLAYIYGGSKIRLRGRHRVSAGAQNLITVVSIIYPVWNSHPNLSKTFWVVL